MVEVTQINRIDEVLTDLKVSNRLLADFLGKSEETVSRWRNNHRQPPLEELNKISEFLQVNRQFLLHENRWAKNKTAPYLVYKKKGKE